MQSGSDTAESVIRDLHDNLTELRLNGKPVDAHPLLTAGGKGKGEDRVADMERWLKERSLSELLQLVDQLDAEDRKFLEEGIRFNMRLAEHGLKFGSGLHKEDNPDDN